MSAAGLAFTPTNPSYGRCVNCGRENQPLAPLKHTTTISYPGKPDATESWVTQGICPDCRSAAVSHLAQMKAAMEDRLRRGGQRSG